MNQTPLFILTCMRSYSSLIGGMLGGHSRIYTFPELNLFAAPRLQGLITKSQLLRPKSLSGLLRATAQICFGGQSREHIDQALAWLSSRGQWTPGHYWEAMTRRVEARVFVEKSPSTTLQEGFLHRLQQHFPRARCLHLTRHPRATCRSIHTIMSRTDAVNGTNKAETTDIEALWFRMHTNIMRFTGQKPHQEVLRIQGEGLLAEPEIYYPQILSWLDLESPPEELQAMRHPERTPYAFIGPSNAPYGNDPNYLKHPYYQTKPPVQESLAGPLEWVQDDTKSFSQETLQLAREFGYTE